MATQTPLHTLKERENYRQEYDPAFVAGIAANMANSGFLEEFPITVYDDNGSYVIIDGHTRYNAALLGSVYDIKTRKPSMIVWVVVKDKPSDAQFKLLQLSANEQRRDPDDISKAIGYKQALDAGATMAELSTATGHKVDYIDRRLTLLKLTDDLKELVAKKILPITYAGAVTKLDSNRQRIAVRAYQQSKNPDLESFEATVNKLYAEQVKENSQLDFFASYSAESLESKAVELASEMSGKKTYKQLEAELAAEKQARKDLHAKACRDYAKLRNAYLKLVKAQTTSTAVGA